MSGRLWACVAVLLLATAIAFSPAFNAELLSWDDKAYVSQNKLLREPGGLAAIWNPVSTELNQYYPLLFTSYWLEYRLWGATSSGYHAVNIGLHLVNVVLVLQLVQALGASAWVAFATAAIFALHPVQVASVAWVAERKNTLSGCFYLVAFLLYLRHRRTGSGVAYGGSLAAFLAAMLSKTQTLTLPVSILMADWLLQRARQLRQQDLARVVIKLLPMLALGLLAVVITTRVEQQKVGVAAFRLPALVERPFIAANAPWFYAYKFVAPINLSPMYPKWDVSAADPLWWPGVLVWPVLLAAVVRWRQHIGTLALWGLTHFCIALSPVLGLIPFGYQQHTVVADHYMYLPIIGAALAVAVWADRLAGSTQWSRRRMLATAFGLLLAGAYAVQSYRESQHWHDTPTFWQRVLERGPNTFAAHFSLGNHHWDRRQWAEAVPFYRRAFEIRSDSPGAFNGYTNALRKTAGEAAALEVCNAALQRDPLFFPAYLQRARISERIGKREDALTDYRRVLEMAPKGSEAWQLANRERGRLQSAPTN